MLYYFVAAMKETLSQETMDETLIYFYTYDDTIHEYDFSGDDTKCVIMDPSIS